jgi:hypothetical protein
MKVFKMYEKLKVSDKELKEIKERVKTNFVMYDLLMTLNLNKGRE